MNNLKFPRGLLQFQLKGSFTYLPCTSFRMYLKSFHGEGRGCHCAQVDGKHVLDETEFLRFFHKLFPLSSGSYIFKTLNYEIWILKQLDYVLE